MNDYKVHVFEIAYLTPHQVEMFQSDFKIVADYFVQLRTNKTYVPSREVIEHVDAVLKLMSVLTQDERFEEFQNSGKGEVKTMCEVLDNAIDQGIAQGIAQGIQRGEAIKLIEMVCKKMQKEKTVEEIAESLEESEETIEKIYQVALKYHADVEEKEKIYEELGDKELR